MSRMFPKSDLFRVSISSLVSALVGVGAVLLLMAAGQTFTDLTQAFVTGYVVGWPVYVVMYVGWGAHVYSRLDTGSLRRVTAADDRDEHQPLTRFLGLTGTTNTTSSAAVVAVVITVVIAQRQEFREDGIYALLALLTVASSWVLLVFSFAQGYLRLGASKRENIHFRFHVPDAPRFTDYFTLATLVSTMAATVPADIISRKAWLLVRTNVVIAFVFNSVIIAMMVSLLFGGLLG